MRDRLISWKARAKTALPPRVQMDAARTTWEGILISDMLRAGVEQGCKRGYYHLDREFCEILRSEEVEGLLDTWRGSCPSFLV